MDYLGKISNIFGKPEDKAKYLGAFEELVSDDIRDYIVRNDKLFSFYNEVIKRAIEESGYNKSNFEPLFFKYVNDENLEDQFKNQHEMENQKIMECMKGLYNSRYIK